MELTKVMSAKSAIFSGTALLSLVANLYGQSNAGTQLWAYVSSGPIAGSPAVGQDGTIYFANGVPTLLAITNGGSNRWTFPITGGVHGASYSSPAVGADGTIYISGGGLYAVNPDGSQKWAYPAGSENGSPAVGLDNTVLIHGYHLLYLLSPGARMIWSNRIGG